MQAGMYLAATRGLAASEARICYERAESLCHSLDRPLLLLFALIGQWRCSVSTDKLSAAMQFAERAHSLAQKQDDPTQMIWACNALAATLYFLGDFESARRFAMRAVDVWHSGGRQSLRGDLDSPVPGCLCYRALSEWHLGEIASCQANMDEAISLAKELKDMHALAVALFLAALLAHYERKPTKVERLASEVIELSTRHHYAQWLPVGSILHGWARSAFGDATEGVSWIERGIADYRAIGGRRGLPFFLALKAEALYLGNRIFEALEAITEAEGLAQRFEERLWRAELHRLRGVLLTAMGAEEVEIEASFCAAIKTAKEQKSVSNEKWAEATYAEYRRQKESRLGGPGFRLPL
jgi:hypothetical protein